MGKSIEFTKMHGLGNDFMVVDMTRQPVELNQQQIKAWANRHTGIGFDQLLTIEESQQADFTCRIFNNDGSEAEQCGNGLRCIAYYLNVHKQLDELSIATKAGVFPVTVTDHDNITVRLLPPQMGLTAVELTAEPVNMSVNTLSLGNPHAILKVGATDETKVDVLGPIISEHPHFEAGANVGFMEIVDRSHIRLRTYERGAGETHACGSNACAAAITGIEQDWLDARVQVAFRYGALTIEWQGGNAPILMTGPARRVFVGTLDTASRL